MGNFQTKVEKKSFSEKDFLENVQYIKDLIEGEGYPVIAVQLWNQKERQEIQTIADTIHSGLHDFSCSKVINGKNYRYVYAKDVDELNASQMLSSAVEKVNQTHRHFLNSEEITLSLDHAADCAAAPRTGDSPDYKDIHNAKLDSFGHYDGCLVRVLALKRAGKHLKEEL